MSQIENKMDGFVPFGGEIRSKYPEDDETVQHAIIDACFTALDDIMYPMDDRGKRSSECQVFFAVQRMYGAEGERDYFLLSDADTIPDEHPLHAMVQTGVSAAEPLRVRSSANRRPF